MVLWYYGFMFLWFNGLWFYRFMVIFSIRIQQKMPKIAQTSPHPNRPTLRDAHSNHSEDHRRHSTHLDHHITVS